MDFEDLDREMSHPTEGGVSPLALSGLGVLSIVWGYNWVVMKMALDYSGALAFAGLRSFLAGGILIGLLWVRHRSVSPGSMMGALVLGLIQTTGFVGLSTWALVSGGAGRIAVLAYTMPLWLLLLAWPILGERLHGRQWLAVGLAFSGLFLIIQPWRLHPELFSLLLAIASGVIWALSSIWVKILQRRGRINLLPMTGWQLLLGGIPLLLIAAPRELGAINWTPYFDGALAYNVVPATVLAWPVWLYLLEALPAGIAGMGMLLTPLIGVIAAWVQLGDMPGTWEGIGMVLIFSGLSVLARYSR